ncbi:23S rRNA (pseudouridine(1915)-N(3))-methyltransferase RlmH [Bartonella sp. DGB1]|uniref:23S rRNA (pseudouridine(1915)-N(3))-methyltransferase RlmH n=1 Tax=Bartonella sp. DGB1 TaxID=3239807 RepID=UPI00352372A6
MKIKFICIGKMKKGAEQELFERYYQRAKRNFQTLGIYLMPVIELPESKSSNVEERKKREGENILSSLNNKAYLILLDELGQMLPTKKFADLLPKLKQTGINNVTFAIGGADGHSEEIKKRADKILSLGLMTFPHQIVRILLAEQIYRNATILLNHPYHRE